MVCEKCNAEHDGSYGSGRFCSKHCAKSHKHTDESKANISAAVRLGMTDDVRKLLSEKTKARYAAHKKESRKPIPGVCEKCGKEHDGSLGSGRFCSKKCSNSRPRTEEDKRKISAALIGRPSPFKGSRLNPEAVAKLKKRISDRKAKKEEHIRNTPFDVLAENCPNNKDVLKAKIVLEQDNKCNCCGLLEWMGKLITLELEHKDGNTNNNSRENLEMLCPNCHSYTDTWRGRNKVRTKKARITDEQFVEALKTNKTICLALKALGLAAKGGNYIRAKRLISLYDVEIRILSNKEVQSTTNIL